MNLNISTHTTAVGDTPPATSRPLPPSVPWHHEQQEFFVAVTERADNILLRATAGSGKTTTIISAAFRLDPRLRVKFFAFNKNAQQQLEARLPDPSMSVTFHKEGKDAWNSHTGRRQKIDAAKLRWAAKDILSPIDYKAFGFPLARLVGLAKSAGLGTEILSDTQENWQGLVDRFSISSDEITPEDLIALAPDLLRESNARADRVIDFDDMLYLPLKHRVTFAPLDVLIIDEAQDTNAVQRALLCRMNPNRLIAVGDPSQAIYGFRGADASAMRLLQQEFSMTVMPLSICQRCSRAVIAEARKYETAEL